MSNGYDWYGIAGIEFHYNGNTRDPEITFNGVRDNSCVIVELTMLERFIEDNSEILELSDIITAELAFGNYMLENSEDVKELIRQARGEDMGA